MIDDFIISGLYNLPELLAEFYLYALVRDRTPAMWLMQDLTPTCGEAGIPPKPIVLKLLSELRSMDKLFSIYCILLNSIRCTVLEYHTIYVSTHYMIL